MKRSQKLKILDFLKDHGYITNRIANDYFSINNPFARIKEIRSHMDIDDIKVHKNGTYFKVFYISKRKAMKYIREQGLQVAA